MTHIYDFSLPGLERDQVDFSAMRGRPILVVNTASKCGFTPQYEGLQAVWSRYRESGLIVVGVPSNDFGQQEPDSNVEIASFCSRNYGVSFPMAARAPVCGPAAIPLFRWLASEGGFFARPRWNFYKYLINRQGELASWFSSVTKPESTRLLVALDRVILDR